jgi:hypothetical protein
MGDRFSAIFSRLRRLAIHDTRRRQCASQDVVDDVAVRMEKGWWPLGVYSGG